MNYKGISKERKRHIMNERYFGAKEKKSEEEYYSKRKEGTNPKEGRRVLFPRHPLQEIKEEEVSNSLGMEIEVVMVLSIQHQKSVCIIAFKRGFRGHIAYTLFPSWAYMSISIWD